MKRLLLILAALAGLTACEGGSSLDRSTRGKLEELDRYIREGIDPPAEKKAKIDRLHKQNLFKLELMESFPFEP